MMEIGFLFAGSTVDVRLQLLLTHNFLDLALIKILRSVVGGIFEFADEGVKVSGGSVSGRRSKGSVVRSDGPFVLKLGV